MFPSSQAVTEQIEIRLKEVLTTLRQESELPDSVLCETDLKAFVKEEESLRKKLKEASSSQSTRWNLFGLASTHEVKCLEDAEALCRRIKESIDERIRTRLSGESNRPSSSREPVRPPSAGGNAELANTSTEITSPANPRHSLPEFSELNNVTTNQEANDHGFNFSEATNTRVSGDRSSCSSSGRRRRPPPPPPLRRRMSQSDDSESNDSSSGHQRRSPPQADISHMANTHMWRGSKYNKSAATEDYGFNIINSHTQGTTLNHNSSNCSGSVSHTVILPSRSSRPHSQV